MHVDMWLMYVGHLLDHPPSLRNGLQIWDEAFKEITEHPVEDEQQRKLVTKW